MSMTLPPVGVERRSDVAAPAMVTVAAKSASATPATAEPARPPAGKSDSFAQLKSMRKELDEALAEANRRMQFNGRALAFSLDEQADRMVIKVTNTVTGELVRQIPDETVLRIAHSLDELKGLLYDHAS